MGTDGEKQKSKEINDNGKKGNRRGMNKQEKKTGHRKEGE